MSLRSLLHKSQPEQQFLLFQSSSSQSALPILRSLLAVKSQTSTLLFCLLYPPSDLVEGASGDVQVHDYLDHIPGYSADTPDIQTSIAAAVEKAPAGALSIVIDSVDTLASDIGSDAETFTFLRELVSIVASRPGPSRLILHTVTPQPILIQSSFSSSLTHITVYPPVILTHLASEYLTPPPPLSPEPKFWGVFLPFSERASETDRLVYGPEGQGSGSQEEIIVQILDGKIYSAKKAEQSIPDPTQNVSFNLNLTPQQQQSRAQVPLPYAHESSKPDPIQGAAIFYDPDSADDIDDDDPDEDLDI
ncbi:Elongator complex protein 5 [Pleurotus pulmonarius]